MCSHLAECRPIVQRPPRPPFFEYVVGWRCAPGCPWRAELYDPIANARAAARWWERRRGRAA